jgi:cytoskeletal protein RodZ
MNTFSDELRKERVSKDISLSDIAKKTHINVKYLEAIEQGSFDILPQTYVRAFIREYALMVGLSPGAVLKKFDVMVSGKYSIGNGALIGSGWSGTTPPSLPEQAAASGGSTKQEDIRSNEKRKLIVGIGIAFLTLVLIYFVYDYTTQEWKAPVAQETPFQEVVREQEAQIQPQKAALDSFAALQAGPKKDSLTLRGVAIDSVWISIRADSTPSLSMLLPPKSSRTWVATESFTLTLGNAGGIRFTLNGTDIGTLGRRGAVLRKFSLTSNYLKSKQ